VCTRVTLTGGPHRGVTERAGDLDSVEGHEERLSRTYSEADWWVPAVRLIAGRSLVLVTGFGLGFGPGWYSWG
jgi:hypothetical protein